MNNISSLCVARYKDKAIFVGNENEVYFVEDQNEVLELFSTIEDEALISIDVLSQEDIREIIQLIERG